MIQNQFTKEEAQASIEAVDEMFKALPKTKRGDYIGHLNDVCLFLERAKQEAPTQAEFDAKK